MTKTLLFIILAVGVLGATTAAGILLHQRGQKTPSTLPTDTFTAPATRQPIIQSVSATGPVASNLDVAIKCRASGEVLTLPFDISDAVKKGDLLVQIDQKDEKVLLEQAQVTLQQSQSRLKEAESTEQIAELDLKTATEQADSNIVSAETKAANLQKKADRQKQLLAQNLASPEECETAETDSAQAVADLTTAKIAREQLKSQAVALEVKKEDVELAKQQVKLDGIDLRNAQQQMDYTTILAPMDGVIADLTIQKGTIISSAISNVGGGTSVMTLSDMSHIFVMASVDESDIGGVRVGQSVDITADAFPGKHFNGKVVRIATQGVNTTNVVTFEVKIEVTSEDKRLLKPQMTANVNIIEVSKPDVLTVPMLAIVRKQHKTFVTVVKPDSSNEDREVTIGVDDGENQKSSPGFRPGRMCSCTRTNRPASGRRPRLLSACLGRGMPGRR